MDTLIRGLAMFAGIVIGEYIVMRRHESDQTVFPQDELLADSLPADATVSRPSAE